jgi:hypothetical protein
VFYIRYIRLQSRKRLGRRNGYRKDALDKINMASEQEEAAWVGGMAV